MFKKCVSTLEFIKLERKHNDNKDTTNTGVSGKY